MTNSRAKNWIKANFWVLLVDAFGAALAMSLILGAGGSIALEPVLFTLLMLVPLTGLMITLTSNLRPAHAPQPVRKPVSTRTIIIAPRPCDLRA